MIFRSIKWLVKILAPVFGILFICEFLVYYAVLWQCHYPEISSTSAQQKELTLRAMFLADTHLLGSRQGHWFDKLRREWQMHRAFQTAQTYFNPELIVFLGDIFDEGKWCDDKEFEYYVQRFRDLFYVPKSTFVHVVAGNHDMGFHYAVTPYLNSRFEEAFSVSSVERFAIKNVQFVSINSMAMEGDQCFLCSEARTKLKQLQHELNCLKDKDQCAVDYDVDLKRFSRPVLLQHFPLFRNSDVNCNELDEAPPNEKSKAFKKGWDCLTKNSSDTLLDVVEPRLILSGHTHHGCRLTHKNNIPEWSVSSFSWRNRNNPTFILGTFTADDFALEKCFLPEENSVIRLYGLLGITFVLWTIRVKYMNRRLHKR